jgi:hypothetical protein
MLFLFLQNYAYGHSLTYAVIVFSKAEHKSYSVKVRIDYMHGQLYTYIQGSLVEIHTPAQWNQINSSRAASPPFLSPSRLFCHIFLIELSFLEGKIWHLFKKYYFNFYSFFKTK